MSLADFNNAVDSGESAWHADEVVDTVKDESDRGSQAAASNRRIDWARGDDAVTSRTNPERTANRIGWVTDGTSYTAMDGDVWNSLCVPEDSVVWN